jgi:hypothetical protein
VRDGEAFRANQIEDGIAERSAKGDNLLPDCRTEALHQFAGIVFEAGNYLTAIAPGGTRPKFAGLKDLYRPPFARAVNGGGKAEDATADDSDVDQLATIGESGGQLSRARRPEPRRVGYERGG